MLRGLSARFYRPPTNQEAEEHGPIIAEMRQRIRARKLGSRVVSATVAVSMGTLNVIAQELFISEGANQKTVIASFGIPAVIQSFVQLRSERTLGNAVGDFTETATEVVGQYESRIEELEDIVEQANLPLPQSEGPEGGL